MPDSTEARATRTAILRHTLAVTVIAVCSLFIALYVGDYLVLRYRMAAHGADSATSTVPVFYAAPLKGGEFDVYYDSPQTQSCVRSIFPWLGYEPCWYLKRHTISLS